MPSPADRAYLEFVYLELFERTARGLVTAEEMRAVEEELLENPEKGSLLGETGGVRKIRAAIRGAGKRGGARIVYLYVRVRSKVYFILAFPKNVQANLTDPQKRAIRALVARLKEEE